MTQADPLPPWPYPRWIAHRGGGTLAPENTLAAFRAGAAQGWRGFECDVKLSSDGVPFLLHDTTLGRTTDGDGVAGDLPWATLSQLDAGSWHGAAYAGEPPPTLASVARFLRSNDLLVDLEIKPTPGTEARTGRRVAAHAERLWLGDAVQPLLSSFAVDALAGAREAAPQLPRALVIDEPWEGWFETAQNLGCVALMAHYRRIDAAFVDRLHRAGMRVLVYTVNDADEAARLLALGVDAVTSDAVGRIAPT